MARSGRAAGIERSTGDVAGFHGDSDAEREGAVSGAKPGWVRHCDERVSTACVAVIGDRQVAAAGLSGGEPVHFGLGKHWILKPVLAAAAVSADAAPATDQHRMTEQGLTSRFVR